MQYYINGEFIPSYKASIPFTDAGFLYGDGLFETMRFDNNKIFSYQNHINRLFHGLEIIDLKISENSDYIFKLLNKVININNLESGIIRLMITRGNSDRNSSFYNVPCIYISIKPFYAVPDKPVKVVYLDETNYPIIRFTPAIKSMNYIGNMLSKRDCEKQGGYEPVFYNKNKIITECAIRNIFFIKDKILYTPTLDLGILSGVMREIVLNIADSINLEIKETYINYNDINSMDEAFISSTGIGLLACHWDHWKSEYQYTNIIKKELFKRIKNS